VDIYGIENSPKHVKKVSGPFLIKKLENIFEEKN
jgi:hypothetical protein